MDRISPEQRSWTMSRVRSHNTGPEILVRKAAHALGLRFRLHRKDLPGTPDLIFPKLRVALFVHGCFWHRHAGCNRASMPKSQTAYWTRKFERNVERDRKADAALEAVGWRPMTIWECQTNDRAKLIKLLQNLLLAGSGPHATAFLASASADTGTGLRSSTNSNARNGRRSRSNVST
jgi:DNA mismatch endonuclease, patch repair protein